MRKGWIYVQKSGEIAICNYDFETPFAVGHAGRAEGRNNPRMQSVRNTGPLPVGRYRMAVKPHPRFHPPAIHLEQIEGESFGRTGFWIHGGQNSEGCIILQRDVREFIHRGIILGFSDLYVVAD